MSAPDPHSRPGSAGDAPDVPGAERGAGLCPGCRHVQQVRTDRGSVFLRCALAQTDSRFRKYPPQPVVTCPGWER